MKRDTIKKGQKFRRLVIIKEVEPYIAPSSKKKYRKFLVQCRCGNKKKVRLGDLKFGKTQSCGCFKDEQANNRISNHFLIYKNKKLTLSQWAKKTKISKATLKSRIDILNWSVKKTLTEPIRILPKYKLRKNHLIK